LESNDQAISEIRTFLSAWPMNLVKQALKAFALERHSDRLADGWEIWTGEGEPPREYEWRRLGMVTHYRLPPRPDSQKTAAATREGASAVSGRAQALKRCPDCGAESFAQPICPACAKGKAGIRKMYVCGENSNHVFYTE